VPGAGVGGVRLGVDDEEHKAITVVAVYPYFQDTGLALCPHNHRNIFLSPSVRARGDKKIKASIKA